MLLAAQVFWRKLHHENNQRWILQCNFRWIRQGTSLNCGEDIGFPAARTDRQYYRNRSTARDSFGHTALTCITPTVPGAWPRNWISASDPPIRKTVGATGTGNSARNCSGSARRTCPALAVGSQTPSYLESATCDSGLSARGTMLNKC